MSCELHLICTKIGLVKLHRLHPMVTRDMQGPAVTMPHQVLTCFTRVGRAFLPSEHVRAARPIVRRALRSGQRRCHSSGIQHSGRLLQAATSPDAGHCGQAARRLRP